MPKVQLFNTQTEQSDIKKRTYVSKETFKTPLRSIQNALAFKIKRPCVLLQTHLRFRSNALAFFFLSAFYAENKNSFLYFE